MKVLVTAKSRNPNFTWNNGIHCTLQGDCTNIDNLIKELKEIKAMINSDANKYLVKYKDLDIKIEFIK